MIRQYEAFCRVQVLAYYMMSNHFHLLVKVPPKVKDTPTLIPDEMSLEVYYRGIGLVLERLLGDGADEVAKEGQRSLLTGCIALLRSSRD